METKRNLKFFTSGGMSPLTIVGWVLTFIGLLLFAVPGTKFFPVIIIAAGLILVGATSSGKSSGDDIEYQAGERVKDMIEKGMIRFELFEKSLKFLQPFVMRGYEFNDEVYYKKGSDGRNRTSVYSAAVLFFTGERINVHRRRFSFVDEEIDEVLGGSYKYIDLDHAEVRESRFERQVGKRLYKFAVYNFVLVAKDGTDVLDMAVDYGADIDKLCEDINRVIKVRTKAHFEKVARLEAERKARLEAAAAEQQ